MAEGFGPVSVEDLRGFVFEEIFRVLGVRNRPALRRLLTPIFWKPAQRFAELAAELDERTAQAGLSRALDEILHRFVSSVETRGTETIPAEGPLLIASNHPGTYDGLIVASRLPRSDMKVIVSEVPILQGLPYARQQMIFTPADSHGRIAAVREMIRHLELGGAMLIFPRGNVEPDPAVMAGAEAELSAWSSSLELMLRKVPQTQVVTAIVSGVLAPECLNHPLTWVRRGRIPRQKVAIFVQVLQQLLFSKQYDLIPRVTYGCPLTGAQLNGLSPAEKMALVIADAKNVLALHLGQFSISEGVTLRS